MTHYLFKVMTSRRRGHVVPAGVIRNRNRLVKVFVRRGADQTPLSAMLAALARPRHPNALANTIASKTIAAAT